MRLLTDSSESGAPSQEREPAERKHLSRRRKRNQNGIPLVAASEMGKVQTESHGETRGRCRVRAQLPLHQQSCSSLKRLAKEGDSPLSTTWKELSRSPRLPYPGLGAENRKSPTSKTKHYSRPIAH